MFEDLVINKVSIKLWDALDKNGEFELWSVTVKISHQVKHQQGHSMNWGPHVGLIVGGNGAHGYDDRKFWSWRKIKTLFPMEKLVLWFLITFQHEIVPSGEIIFLFGWYPRQLILTADKSIQICKEVPASPSVRIWAVDHFEDKLISLLALSNVWNCCEGLWIVCAILGGMGNMKTLFIPLSLIAYK